MISFDVKSLFSNVPIDGAIRAMEEVLVKITDSDLPVNKRDYVSLVKTCVKFGSFSFNNSEYRQHEGLPMGSPLSAVLACLFMEKLETDHFSKIIPSDAKWYRYVDDCLVILHNDTNIDELLLKLNDVHSRIQFTVETEENQALPFLDTVIMRSDDSVKFKVYRKPTNKDDYIHYLSAHDEKTKTGVVIGFFLRALRICSDDYLQEEINNITETFADLGYPKGVLAVCLKKAKYISQRGNNVDEESNKRYLVVPNSKFAQELSSALRHTGLIIITDAGKKINELVKRKVNNAENEESVVYKIPCTSCDTVYYGETYRGIDKRLKEHKADVRYHRTTSALVNHIDEKNHLPNWKEAIVIEKGLTKQQRKVLEALFIANNNDNMNQRTGDLKWCFTAAKYGATERINKTRDAGTRSGARSGAMSDQPRPTRDPG